MRLDHGADIAVLQNQALVRLSEHNIHLNLRGATSLCDKFSVSTPAAPNCQNLTLPFAVVVLPGLNQISARSTHPN
jgi:hypothetical protein